MTTKGQQVPKSLETGKQLAEVLIMDSRERKPHEESWDVSEPLIMALEYMSIEPQKGKTNRGNNAKGSPKLSMGPHGRLLGAEAENSERCLAALSQSLVSSTGWRPDCQFSGLPLLWFWLRVWATIIDCLARVVIITREGFCSLFARWIWATGFSAPNRRTKPGRL